MQHGMTNPFRSVRKSTVWVKKRVVAAKAVLVLDHVREFCPSTINLERPQYASRLQPRTPAPERTKAIPVSNHELGPC